MNQNTHLTNTLPSSLTHKKPKTTSLTHWINAAGALICCALCALSIFAIKQQPLKHRFLTPLSQTSNHSFKAHALDSATFTSETADLPFHKKQALSTAGELSVHSATMTPLLPQDPLPQHHTLPPAILLAAWYGGSREGAKDVRLYKSAYRPVLSPDTADTQGIWDEPTVLLDRIMATQQLNRYIKKVGNPVLFTGEDGRVWLFFVSVSVGGWAGSAINVTVSEDGGQHFGPIRRLTTTPFFNISTLVRNRPIPLQDGGLVVPIYHELMGKFCELLWLDASGHVRDKQRLTWGRSTLQPTIVARSATEAAVFLRAAPPKFEVHTLVTHDGGASFSTPIRTGLPNANAAIDASLLPDGRWVLVYNHDPNGRDNLSIAAADHAEGPWRTLHVLAHQEPGSPEKRFAYPVMVPLTPNNDFSDLKFHVMYTVERQYIQHETFNLSWLAPSELTNNTTLSAGEPQ